MIAFLHKFNTLAFFYRRVTGPYWALMISSDIPYLELYKQVPIMSVLENDPAVILCDYLWKDVHVQHEKTLTPLMNYCEIRYFRKAKISQIFDSELVREVKYYIIFISGFNDNSW